MHMNNYRKVVTFLAGQPPMTITLTPLEIFLAIEVLLRGIASMTKTKLGATALVNKLIAILATRYPRIAGAITAVHLKQSNS
ncbi:hypothetical protein CYANOKiyG1_57200 [Okeania sp. KiyG1]|nr:hypothetical protein CYANOKiyG1_57200 [Okeania sp. KiyG1]